VGVENKNGDKKPERGIFELLVANMEKEVRDMA
jgi:hypothetical protein